MPVQSMKRWYDRWIYPRTPWMAVGTVVVAAAGASVVALTGSHGGGTASAADVVEVSPSRCGDGWSSTGAGWQTLMLRNTGIRPSEAYLFDVSTGAVYGEAEGLAPGATRPMRANLGPGRYAIRCLPEDTEAVTGPVVRVVGSSGTAATGPAPGTGPASVPVTQNELLGPLRRYRDHVTAGLAELVTGTDALRDAVHSGDRAAAQAAWLPAHLSYERLGAAYDTFGDFAEKIDGRADGLPGGVHDPDFAGFHRVEYGLWHGESLAAVGVTVDALDRAARGLRDDFPDEQTDPNDLGLRTHEILENSLQFELTSRTDQGSGTNLATVQANLRGTAEVLSVLRPLLATRYSGLSGVDIWLARANALVAAARRPGGGWTPVDRLAPAERARLNGTFGELLERLAPIAAICEVRRTS